MRKVKEEGSRWKRKKLGPTCVIDNGGFGLAQSVMCLDCVSISHIDISLLPFTADTTHDPSFGCILTRRTPAPTDTYVESVSLSFIIIIISMKQTDHHNLH